MNRAMRILGVSLLALVLGCAAMPPPQLARDAAPDRPTVVVLESYALPMMEVFVKAFLKRINARVYVIANAARYDGATLKAVVDGLHPQLVLTLGMQATLFAQAHIEDTPVIFGLVLNHARHHLGANANMAGIAMEPAPLSEFTKFKMVAPGLNRVQVYYTVGVSDGLVAQAKEELTDIGVTVEPVAVDKDGDVIASFRQHSRDTDAVWLVNDPHVMRVFERLRDQARDAKIPLLTSLSGSFARRGALMSASVDVGSLGDQAANMARMMLERGAQPRQLGVQRPNGVSLVLNAGVARALGIDVSLDVLPFVNEVVADSPLSMEEEK
jgi:ABC-type uncharacterized transport system substrate-binding protein